ncbi:MAG: YbaK/EbsC family protein [Chloroflexota bacterium]
MSNQPLTSIDLQRFLDENNVDATILSMTEHTPTVPDAARALNVETDQIIKSLVFMIRGEPVLLINNGVARVDPRKVAAHLEVGRKRVKFATPDQAFDIAGYIVGSMPPFGHRQKLRTLVDTAILEIDPIFGGGGDLNAMMRLTTTELLRVTAAEVVSISEV